MSNDEFRTKDSLCLSGTKRVEARKSIETGQVRQQFSRGRQKTVQVEIKRRRRGAAESQSPLPAASHSDDSPGLGLSHSEREARTRALLHSLREQSEHKQTSLPTPPTPQFLKGVDITEEAELAPVPLSPESDMSVSEVVKNPSVEELQGTPLATSKHHGHEAVSNDAAKRNKKERAEPKRPALSRRDEPRRRSGRITISQALEREAGEKMRSLASVRRRRERERQRHQHMLSEQRKVSRDVVIPETITVQELASRMAERAADVVKALMRNGMMTTITQTIDGDSAELIAVELGHKPRRVADADVESKLERSPDSPDKLRSRPPVVTVMGHVDHGKTSLLDALREANIASGEAGGITQHIGAYQVKLSDDRSITFIDTPGHAAFAEMRARGARVTDIVVLVVAADDGVMPQTIEAIRHAKIAKVPLVVAINKSDLQGADPNQVRDELLRYDVQVESRGGDVLDVLISVKEKKNLDKLLEAILLQAEILDPKANPEAEADGVVLEARLERGRGPTVTVLIQRGTLRVGDILVAGNEWGKIRALSNDQGVSMRSAIPSMPVAAQGLSGAPCAGDRFAVVASEQSAREVVDYRRRAKRSQFARSSMDEMFSKIAKGHQDELSIILKSDAHGSLEAVSHGLESLGNDDVKIRILHAAVGAITEADVRLAKTTQALIVGFHVRAAPKARDLAKQNGIKISYHNIIYQVIDDARAQLEGMLAPKTKENAIGRAQVQQLFSVGKIGKIAGCYVTEGRIVRSACARLLRDDVVVHEGRFKSLKRFKDDAREVVQGLDCGIFLEGFHDLHIGDVIECYEIEAVERSLT